MKFTFLGTGTSTGVPVLGCQCKVCQSNDPHDNRRRTSGLLETETTRILIDCGPDLREQLMPVEFRRISGVLLTHQHYDHVGGLDDLRPYCKFGDIDIYGNETTIRNVKHNFPYCFVEHLYPGVPKLSMHVIEPHEGFTIGDIPVMPIEVMHASLPILGYRFGNFAYITDMKSINDSEYAYLEGVDTLVVNALRWEKSHQSHILVGEAIAFSRKIGARLTYLTHLTHDIGLHEEAEKRLPEGFHFAYDGLQIDVE